jgi:hypothetical protein
MTVRVTLYLFKAPSGPARRATFKSVYEVAATRRRRRVLLRSAAAPFSSRRWTERAPAGEWTVALLKAIAVVRDTRALPFQDIERFHQARLVRITLRRLAIWLTHSGCWIRRSSWICLRRSAYVWSWWSITTDLFGYLGATAIAWATKMIGQTAMNTIIPKQPARISIQAVSGKHIDHWRNERRERAAS